MKTTLSALLASGQPVVADGAMGSILMAAGLEAGRSPELWNVEQPETIAQVHRGYIRLARKSSSPTALAAAGPARTGTIRGPRWRVESRCGAHRPQRGGHRRASGGCGRLDGTDL